MYAAPSSRIDVRLAMMLAMESGKPVLNSASYSLSSMMCLVVAIKKNITLIF